ncbi:MAG: hypothetical protein GY797_33420 [Deltaproteobacteria bacterium]|nr:hypothetical protein [Deltaproteobacteria bacterium]
MSDSNESKLNSYRESVVKRKNERNIDDIKEITKTPSGRRFIWDLIIESGLYENRYIEDEKLMYFWAGKKNLGHSILLAVDKADCNLYAKMQMEWFSEIKSEKKMEEKYLDQDNADSDWLK